MDVNVIEQIYESAFAPDLWPEVLDNLAQSVEAPGGSLLIYRGDVLHWTASPGVRLGVEMATAQNWMNRGRFMTRLLGAANAGFVTESDIFTEDELTDEPIYRDFWRPTGFGWNVGAAIPLPTGENVIFSLNRLYKRGPVEPVFVERLDVLRPHIARSVLISARLQLERARAAGEALALIGLPALVLDERGKVLYANSLIEALTGVLRWRARDRIALTDIAADALMREAIERLHRHDAQPICSFPLRDAEGVAVKVAHIAPVRRSALDIFPRCAAVLILTPVAAPDAPPIELLQSLFDLTPAEARVARGLASGAAAEDIAKSGGVSVNTIRTQLRGVLEKTGCSRQAEVVALLAGVAPPGFTRRSDNSDFRA